MIEHKIDPTKLTLVITTSDEKTFYEEFPAAAIDKARRKAQMYIRTGYSSKDVLYSASNTVKTEIIRADPEAVEKQKKVDINEVVGNGDSPLTGEPITTIDDIISANIDTNEATK